MPTTETPRIIVVTGATGNQGSGVVRALLASEENWHIRALTRDVNSSWAKALVDELPRDAEAGRLSLVQGHAYDPSSLRSAFARAHGVFAVTSEIYPGKVLVEEAEMAHEIEAGRNMVFAAKEAGVKHFVFSSLPDMDKTTRGQYPGIHHMNNKHAVEKIANEHLSGVTCLIPVLALTEGFVFSLRRFLLYESEMASLQPTPVKQVAQWTDPSYDMGSFAASKSTTRTQLNTIMPLPFAHGFSVQSIVQGTDRGYAEIFDLGAEKTAGKTYLVMSPLITPKEMAETFTKVTGQPAVHDPISPETFGEMTAPFVGPAFKLDAQKMMDWASVTPSDKVCFGAMDHEKMNDAFEELGLQASTFENWLRRSGWKGPE
ncbi:hypothetical protein FSARC_11797 [Fusarium sarcochroum]|uniref:NmrA-like domain-containing protein n=1 Tax=Fusarium sarcochroum TaxID=1208366 RepID=A0A8H4TD89_9HYPO|nr:hypothetical protein FSARC_11797 [Fusarium sarcochroum]